MIKTDDKKEDIKFSLKIKQIKYIFNVLRSFYESEDKDNFFVRIKISDNVLSLFDIKSINFVKIIITDTFNSCVDIIINAQMLFEILSNFSINKKNDYMVDFFIKKKIIECSIRNIINIEKSNNDKELNNLKKKNICKIDIPLFEQSNFDIIENISNEYYQNFEIVFNINISLFLNVFKSSIEILNNTLEEQNDFITINIDEKEKHLNFYVTDNYRYLYYKIPYFIQNFNVKKIIIKKNKVSQILKFFSLIYKDDCKISLLFNQKDKKFLIKTSVGGLEIFNIINNFEYLEIPIFENLISNFEFNDDNVFIVNDCSAFLDILKRLIIISKYNINITYGITMKISGNTMRLIAKGKNSILDETLEIENNNINSEFSINSKILYKTLKSIDITNLDNICFYLSKKINSPIMIKINNSKKILFCTLTEIL